MADPKGTFEKYLQQALPADLAIHAHYNAPDEVHFVVPRRPASLPDELTDEDLERVAGGETIDIVFSAATQALSEAVSGAFASYNFTLKKAWGDVF